LGRLPWLALLRRARSLRFFVFLLTTGSFTSGRSGLRTACSLRPALRGEAGSVVEPVPEARRVRAWNTSGSWGSPTRGTPGSSPR
jgi:hypothetical protein